MFLYSYLKQREQFVSINNFKISSKFLLTGLHRSNRRMLGLLLLNIFINDLLLFLQNSYLHNFADDDIIWAFVNDMNLEKESETDQVI